MVSLETNSQILAKVDDNSKLSKSLKRWIANHLPQTIGASVAMSLILLGGSAWNIWIAYRGFEDNVNKQFRLGLLSKDVVYWDEVLTKSAQMAATTGDKIWEQKYQEAAPKLDETINQIKQKAPNYQSDIQQTDTANQKLITMENKSFDLVAQGQLQKAQDLLLGEGYKLEKDNYKDSINDILTRIQSDTDTQLKVYGDRLQASLYFAGISFPILIISWVIIGVQVRDYIKEREKSQKALYTLNKDLSIKTEAIIDQERQKTEENEVLQEDIASLLDVVSCLEDGDLTIQAEVNERATGLVADTLNRLIEGLTRTIVQVLETSEQVRQKTTELERLAVSTQGRAKQQVDSVTEVQGLMDNVNTLSEETAKIASQAFLTVQETAEAIKIGQGSMVVMAEGVKALQQGREQIIRRAQTLSDYVELASQFVREQKRAAALTRVLAFNASTIATRAAGLHDPEQFTMVVKEFDVIAQQINSLATETNQGLQMLQQRTDQLQIVTSGLNQDVQDINELVNNFTEKVNQSNEIFTTIESVTQELLDVEQKVNDSSVSIRDAAQTTLKAVTEIARISEQTQASASDARLESSILQKLADQLLERVKFFQVNRNLNNE